MHETESEFPVNRAQRRQKPHATKVSPTSLATHEAHKKAVAARVARQEAAAKEAARLRRIAAAQTS